MKIDKGKLMRRILVLILIAVAANFYFAYTDVPNSVTQIVSGNDTTKVLSQQPYMKQEDELINTILSRYHYRKFDLNDSLSSVILSRIIKSLDYNRSFFYASDIKSFEQYRNKLDDDIKQGDLSPAYNIFNVFLERMNNRIDYVHQLLKTSFDFTKDENYQFKRDSAAWIKDEKEMNELWRKKVKSDALNLLLAKKDWPYIVKTLEKRYENYRKAFSQFDNEDVFQLAMNSFTESIDPHTNYMSPITSENFKIDMARSLEGIGAQLQSEDEYTKVAKIVAGGPAFKSNLLHNGDRITAVAQGDTGEMIDVIGWKLNDVVQLIRGDKGTVVRLQILKASDGVNAAPKEIKLVRDKVKLEEMSAKQDTLDIINDKVPFRFGVISLPAFYSDFEGKASGDKDYKSTTKDVQKIIDKLKTENVDGIIIDLRNNGGGSLQEAIALTGLFIKSGPVVQVKNSDGTIDVGKDPDHTISYTGPIVVLVNRFSASASEIFSAAIQDYGRGLIIGENTYGKGTVQNMIDLNRILQSNDEKYGQVKLTIAKFYRITGASTQHLGVKPDIEFPSYTSAHEFGESAQPSALPWDQINSLAFAPYGDINKYIPKLEEKHLDRIKNSPEFQDLIASVNEYKEDLKKDSVSLNKDMREQEKKEEEDKKFERENNLRKKLGLKLLKKGETSANNINSKDAELDEAGYILSDYIMMTIG
ncbi:MAG TPA: carboxy terminal-processing peptidase [Ignavibacteriaceae bacterium]|nr:carboxy terminal-processing peptidase [Ignavibacteriaceae bacterium]